MLLRKKTKSLIVVSLAIIGLASTSIVNARSLIASNTSLVQIESKGTHPTGSVTKGNYTVNSSILTKPSMGQAAARGILTVGSPKPAKDMGLSMTLWGTEYSLIAATPYYYNTNGTTAVSVTTRYADGYSTFTTGGDMKYNNLSSNWRFKQAKWISPYNKNSDKLVENVFENYKRNPGVFRFADRTFLFIWLRLSFQRNPPDLSSRRIGFYNSRWEIFSFK